MLLEQAHEQHNVIVQNSGDTVGLTANSVAFNKWVVAGPEQARLVLEIEGNVDETIGKV